MEPPGEDLPASVDIGEVHEGPGRGPADDLGPDSTEGLDALRLVAAAAAALLALVTRGNVLVLGGLLAIAAGGSVAAAAALAAAVASLVRWGTASLAAAAGAQAVLGPALLVGSWRAAASAAFAAVALVLLARDRRTAPAFGLAAAAVAAGPMLPHDIGVRLLGVVVGVGAAHAATRLPRAAASAALVAGVVALALSAAA